MYYLQTVIQDRKYLFRIFINWLVFGHIGEVAYNLFFPVETLHYSFINVFLGKLWIDFANKSIFVLPLLTACHIQITGLLIKWEEGEVHPTGTDERHSEMDKMLTRLWEGF